MNDLKFIPDVYTLFNDERRTNLLKNLASICMLEGNEKVRLWGLINLVRRFPNISRLYHGDSIVLVEFKSANGIISQPYSLFELPIKSNLYEMLHTHEFH